MLSNCLKRKKSKPKEEQPVFTPSMDRDDIQEFYNTNQVLESTDDIGVLAKVLLSTLTESERLQAYQQITEIAQKMEEFNQAQFMPQSTPTFYMYLATLYMASCWSYTSRMQIESVEEVDDETESLEMAIATVKRMRKSGNKSYDCSYA